MDGRETGATGAAPVHPRRPGSHLIVCGRRASTIMPRRHDPGILPAAAHAATALTAGARRRL